MLYPDAVDIMFVAVIGALFTMGATTGSFAPLLPTVTRSETPKKFWFGMMVCALIVISNLAQLAWLVFRW
jgi:hypothetical protein